MLSDVILLVMLLGDAPADVFRALGAMASGLGVLSIALWLLLRRVAAIEVKPCPHCRHKGASAARWPRQPPPRPDPPPNPPPRRP